MQVVSESRPARTPVANPLLELRRYGQSIWLDYIRRHFITSGELQRLVEEDGLCGVTSNPSIFEKAVTGSTDYDDILSAAVRRRERDPAAVYEALAVRDIQDAAEVLRPLYEQLRRRDGYVSLEVSPLLAHDTQGTVAEARRLWKAVGRDNVLIKVPGTEEGVPAIRQLISEGINVNITLLFAREMYEKVAEAYLAGLEQFAARGGDLARVASVASFFVSRIDRAVDAILTERLRAAAGGSGQAKLPGCSAKWRLPTRNWPTRPTRRSCAVRAGRRWPERGRDSAAALGQHEHQKSQLPRRRLRGGADRARDHQHHAARHNGRISRARPGTAQFGGRH